MQRLSGLDASFLYLETAAQPLHVCSILELDTSTVPGGCSEVQRDLAPDSVCIPGLSAITVWRWLA